MKKTLMMLITITMIISSALPASAALTGNQTDSITMERIGNHLIYTQVVPINRYLTVDGTRMYVAYGKIQLGIVKLELNEKLPLVPEKFLLEAWKIPAKI